MQKPFNLRVPVVCAVALTAGIAVGYFAAFYKAGVLWAVAAVIPFAAAFVFLLIKKSARAAAITLIVCFCLFAGILHTFSSILSFSESPYDDGVVCTVEGTVSRKGIYDYGEYIIITNAKIGGRPAGGYVYCALPEGGEECGEGWRVRFNASVEKYDCFAYGKLTYNARQNVRFYCKSVSGFESARRFSLFGAARARIRASLYDNLDKDTAAVCYAMLTGDDYGVDDGALQAMRYGGIAHIFAVSGLHIGIIYGGISLILKKLRINRFAAAGAALAAVFFYAGVCGFTLSSVRAAIMCAVLSLSGLTGKKYDGLNSLAAAVCLILFISPLSLFDVGFRLSVCAVGGIILLSPNLRRAMRKLPERAQNAVCTPLAATAGTSPVMLASFGYLSGAGLLLNIAVIPLLSVIYAIIFVCTCVVTVIPAAGIIIAVGALPLQAIISFVTLWGFEKALISGFGGGAFAAIYFAGILILSDKLNLKALVRRVAAACVALSLVLYCVVRAFAGFFGYSLSVTACGDGGVVVLKSARASAVIISGKCDPEDVQSALYKSYCSRPDAIIALGREAAENIYGALFDFDRAFLYADEIDLHGSVHGNVNYTVKFGVGGVVYTYLSENCLEMRAGDAVICVSCGVDIPVEKCDLLICNGYAAVCESEQTAYFDYSPYGGACAYEAGTLYYGISPGHISLYTLLPAKE